MAIRHSITLSTSEPNNEVGNLKIRQGDEQTQTLVANITENGVPKPFTGLQPFFCAKLGQTAGLGIIEQKVTGPMNPANGTLEYIMQPEDWQQLGRQTAYFSFRKMVNDHEWTEQFSTRDFNYNVTKSAFSEGVKETKKDGSTYIWTIEDMLRLFKEYMATGKIDWENYKNDEKTIWEKFVEDNREFLENADPGGKIILELLGGRGGFDSLGERLDEENTTTNIKFNTHNIKHIAHRGAESIAPQNTIYSTEQAGLLGYHGVECDLQVTSDGEWVLFHDDTLDVLTNGAGTVLSKTLTEIKSLNIDNGPYINSRWLGAKIPTLREFLEVCAKWNLIPFLELKHFNTSDLTSLLSILKEKNMLSKAVIMSTLDTTSYLKTLDYNCNVCTFIAPTNDAIDELANAIPFSIGALPHTSLTAELTNAMTSKGLQCLVWTNGATFADFADDYKKWGVAYTGGGIF